MLTTLVSTINYNDIHLTIFKRLEQNPSFDEQKLPMHDLVLHVIAAILVCDFEIVETICHNPNLNTVRKANRPPTEVFAPSSVEDFSYFLLDGTEYMAEITGVTNSWDNDK